MVMPLMAPPERFTMSPQAAMAAAAALTCAPGKQDMTVRLAGELREARADSDET